MDLGAIIICFIVAILLFFIVIISISGLNKIEKYSNILEDNRNKSNLENIEHKDKDKNQNTKKSINEILYDVKYNFTPRQFEVFCYYLFLNLGYKVELTKYEYDGGKDLILDGHIVVECKKFITQKVGREICQKLLGSMLQNKADKAIIINTGAYNSNALQIQKDVEALKLLNFYDIKLMLFKIGEDLSNDILIKTLKYRG